MSRSARLNRKTCRGADIELLIDNNLHMVDVVPVPDRLEHSVGKAQHQNVPHGLFAEIVIDPVDLALVEDA